MRRRYTAEERERFVDEVRTTGASVKEVAARLGLDTSIGYRWMQAARQEKRVEYVDKSEDHVVAGGAL